MEKRRWRRTDDKDGDVDGVMYRVNKVTCANKSMRVEEGVREGEK